MPYSQKSALPRSAGSRRSRIRQYRPLGNPLPRRQQEAPHAPLRPEVSACPAPAREPGSVWRTIRFDGLNLADWTLKVSCWMRHQVDWMRRLPAISSPLAGLKPHPRDWTTRHWKPLATVLIGLAAVAGGKIAFVPYRSQAIVQGPKANETLVKPRVADSYGAAAVIPSPNWDERPSGTEISAVVMHATATATGQEAVNTFRDPASLRSAHFVIDRNGAIIEMVPPERRAWHAGKSALDGVQDLNNFSVGIELVDRNDGQPYSDAQYKAVASLIGRLRMHYNIPDDRIISHAFVALPSGRKTDPVGFDFSRLFADLRA